MLRPTLDLLRGRSWSGSLRSIFTTNRDIQRTALLRSNLNLCVYVERTFILTEQSKHVTLAVGSIYYPRTDPRLRWRMPQECKRSERITLSKRSLPLKNSRVCVRHLHHSQHAPQPGRVTLFQHSIGMSQHS